MRFLIIGNFIRARTTGVQRVAIEVTKALISSGASVLVLCRQSQPRPEWLPEENVVRIPDTGGRGAIFQMLHVPFWLSAHQRPADLVVNFTNVGFPWPHNFVICIHDCAVFRNRQWFSWRFWLTYRLFLPLVAQTAAAITTVSEFSKKEIMRFLPSSQSKCHVVPNGVSRWWAEAPELRTQSARPYFLVVGSLDPRKGLKTVVEAWRLFLEETRSNAELLIVGGEFKTFSSSALPALTHPGVRLLGYVSDPDLRALYAGAVALVNASHYEGFGLPIVEARLARAALILSDIEPFREVAGADAWFFPPGNSRALADLLGVAAGSTPRPARTLSPQDFRWETAAQAYLGIAATFSPPPAI